MTDIDKFWKRVDKKDSGCWEWTGKICYYGYGIFYQSPPDKRLRAHRYSYELHKGPINKGLHIDHLCRNRKCVNPNHLEAVTRKENILRGNAPSALNARKTHCLRGHPYLGKNLVVAKRGRLCRICLSMYRKRYYDKYYR